MSLYIYAPTMHAGTQDLIDAIEAKRLYRFDGMHFWYKNDKLSFTKNDTILCWGQCLPQMEPQRVLNSSLTIGSYVDVIHQVFLTGRMGLYGVQPTKNGIKYVDSTVLPHPLSTIKKDKNNYEAKSILSPDLFERFRKTVYLVKMANEYELHMFGGNIIYARIKTPVLPLAPSEDAWVVHSKTLAHPWYKSSTTGWKAVPCVGIENQNPDICEFGRTIMAQTGLLFGVVYIGQMAQNLDYCMVRKITVLPELDADTVKIYAEHIKRVEKG